jgi:septum formation protein
MRLILASQSPRRADLLRAAGFPFDIVSVDVDESVRAGESPQPYVQRLAEEKVAAAVKRMAGGPAEAIVVLGADTAVIVDGEILGKPRDAGEGAAMLRRLSGRRHEVLTGVSLRCNGRDVGSVESTSVEFAALSESDIAWYVASGEGRDKAGGYAIQGLASRFVTRIDGSYTNVVGLPIPLVTRLLAAIEEGTA